MSNQYKETKQYVCKCGKAFSGKPKNVEMLLKLHYKICKCPKVPETLRTIVTTSGNNPHSQKKIACLSDFEAPPQGISEIKKFIGST